MTDNGGDRGRKLGTSHPQTFSSLNKSPEKVWGRKGPKSRPLGAKLTAFRAGTLNRHPDAGGRTEGNVSPSLPLRGHTAGVRGFAPRHPPQASAAAALRAETGLGAGRPGPRPAWS